MTATDLAVLNGSRHGQGMSRGHARSYSHLVRT